MKNEYIEAAKDGFFGSFRLFFAIIMAVVSTVTAFVNHNGESGLDHKGPGSQLKR